MIFTGSIGLTLVPGSESEERKMLLGEASALQFNGHAMGVKESLSPTTVVMFSRSSVSAQISLGNFRV